MPTAADNHIYNSTACGKFKSILINSSQSSGIQVYPQEFKYILRNSSISDEFMDSIPYAAAALSPARP